MHSSSRRAALPAVIIAAIGAALIASIIRPEGAIMQVPPVVVAGLGIAYLIVAMLITGADAGRTIVVVSVMVGAHLVVALVMGLCYDIFEPQPRGFPDSLQFALFGYLPGTLLQAAVVFMVAPVAAAWYGGEEMERRRCMRAQMPTLRSFETFETALDALCDTDEIAGAVVGDEDEAYAGGIWRADPKAARRRAWGLLTGATQTRQFFDLGDAGLLAASRHGRVVAVMVTDRSDAWLAEDAANRLFDAALYFIGPP